MRALLPSEVLAKAADLIEPEGAWLQGAFAADELGSTTDDFAIAAAGAVCFCLFGALSVAAGRRPDADVSMPGEERFICAAIGFPEAASGTRIAAWNDAPDRTQAEVVTALRAASELAKAEGQ